MICKQCGAQIPDNLYFCPECGTKGEDIPVQEEPQKKKMPRFLSGWYWKIDVIAVILIIATVMIVVFMSNRKTVDRIDYADYISCSVNSFFWNMEGSRYSTEVEECLYNGNCSLAAYTVYEGDTKTLYYIDSTLEPKRVAEDVVSYAISYTGEYIAYIADAESEVSGTLYLYCLKTEKTEEIDSGVYPEYLCLSPTGQTVAYIRDFEDVDDFCLYLGGVKIRNREVNDDNCMPVAVTDNGKTLYYINDNYKLYVYDGKESEKLASGVGTSFFFNRDLSELLFSEAGETYYYNRKLEEPVKVSGSAIQNIIIPEDITYFSSMDGCSNILGTDTLKGSVLQTDKGIYWFNREGTDAVKISGNTAENLYRISEDGKSAICVMNNGLYEIEKLNDNMEAKLLYDKETIEYVLANADLSRIYLVIDGELHYLKGKNKTEELTDDFEAQALAAAYHEEAKKLFFIEDNALYSVGTKEKSVEEVVAENVVSVYAFADGIMYLTEEEGKVSFFYIGEEEEPVRLGTY